MNDRRNDHARGVLLVLACAALWSLSGPLIKQLKPLAVGHSLLDVGLMVAAWRSTIAGLALLPFCTRSIRTLPRTGWWLAAAGGFCVMSCMFVAAMASTTAANAIVLEYTATIWIFLLSPVLLGEIPRRHDWIVMPIAMSGIAVIFLWQFSSDAAGLVLGVGAGLAFAVVVLSYRKLRGIDAIATSCVVNLATAALVLPAALWRGAIPQDWRIWVLLTVLGVIQTAIPYWLLSLGLQRVSASEASLISLSEILFNPAWTFLWVGEKPHESTIFGGALIVAALLLKHRLDRAAASPAPPAHPS